MTRGAYHTNDYTNRFLALGIDQQAIDDKIIDTWERLFTSKDPALQIYFETRDEMGYVVDTGNNDVRTEGQSYGMMMAVQMGNQDVFDRIWKWTKTHMYMEEGLHQGYFAWSCQLDGTKNAYGPAPDGEEYFAMSLFFASHRFGDREAPFNYSEQAREILSRCLRKGDDETGHTMWDLDNYLIKFVPEVDFSDPSYHLPHFYELFGDWANEEDRPFWKEAAKRSRDYITLAAHPVTGLSPEYAFYDGTPNHIRGFGDFFSDSYRVCTNIALDYEWFGDETTPLDAIDRLHQFFKDQPVADYRRYKIDGTPFDEPALHPVGLFATLAAGGLVRETAVANDYVKTFFDMPLRQGDRRYYDNCLYFFSLLALAGRFTIYSN
ncbi:MAG: glycosyl hydrolase family 8 [Bacillota bacterium]